MRKCFLSFFILCLVAMAAFAAPQFGLFDARYSGAVASFIANSGTNTSVEVLYEGEIPFRLFEVVATTNGVATDVAVSRIWYLEVQTTETEVSTNMFGTVSTNNIQVWTRSLQTNEVYDSTSDTLPVASYFIQTDVFVADFGAVTNVALRVLGTAQ